QHLSRKPTDSLLPSTRPMRVTLFAYTTLFRSRGKALAANGVSARGGGEMGATLGDGGNDRFSRMVPGGHLLRHDDRELHPKLLRSEEHTSELQSRGHLVCRLLLENKNKELPVN